MKEWIVALGFVALGAFLWASFGDAVTKTVSDKVSEMQAGFANELQRITSPRK